MSRITQIQKSHEVETREQPPSYEEAVASTPTETPQTYNDLANALNQITIDTDMTMEAEVMFMYENVKLYFISPSGEVSSTLTPQTLKITLVESKKDLVLANSFTNFEFSDEGQNVPRAILQIGDWVYPLISGVSPCFRSDYGAFILPNIYAETPGTFLENTFLLF